MVGLKIDTGESVTFKEAMTNFIKQYLDVDVKVDRAYKLENRTCVLKLENLQDKTMILQSKSKLRN